MPIAPESAPWATWRGRNSSSRSLWERARWCAKTGQRCPTGPRAMAWCASDRAAPTSRITAVSTTPHSSRLRKAVTVTDPVELSQLALELDALPPFPAEPILCPLGEGAYYLIALHYLGDRDMTLKAED